MSTPRNIERQFSLNPVNEETSAELAVDINKSAWTGRTQARPPAGVIGITAIIMIGLGGVIGSGIFVASGIPVHVAGPGRYCPT